MPPKNFSPNPTLRPVPARQLAPDRAARQESDALLIALSASGDAVAFAALYDRLAGPLLAMILRLISDRSEAEDVLQETFLQLWKKAATYDARQSTVFSWAMLVARSRAIDLLRRKTRRARIISEGDPDEVPVIAPLPREAPESNLDLNRCLDHLAQTEREVIDLAFFSGLTHEEIADRLAQPLGTIKSRIRRGLLKLRSYFSRET